MAWTREDSPLPPRASNRDPGPAESPSPIVGRSPAAERLRAAIARAAPTDLPILVLGETGAGKEAVARRLHELGRTPRGPFVAVNCSALAEGLLDAELFGTCRGAFTGADQDRPGLFREAHGGTLFLDEVGDMTPPMQTKLLRALETRRVRPVGGDREFETDARIVAATHRALEVEVEAGRFRADLYHRLAVLRIRVPALRERLDDLPAIVRSLAPRLERETGLAPLELSRSAWLALAAHDWPGNVRELHAVLARAILAARGEPLAAEHLDDLRLGPRRAREPSADLERAMIEAALRRAEGSVAGAARAIGWTRQKLYRRLAALGIERPPSGARVRPPPPPGRPDARPGRP